SEQAVVTSLPHPADPQPDTDVALLAAGRLWAAGVALDPAGLWPNGGRRIPLPTYPFERQLHWVDSSPSTAAPAQSAPNTTPIRRSDPADWLFAPSWRRVPNPVGDGEAAIAGAPRRWLLFCDERGLGERLAARLRDARQDVICVQPSSRFARVG